MHSSINAQRGFTMIELMLTVSVLAVLLGLAVPSFLETVRTNRMISQNNEFIGSLNFARSEALKRSDSVSACASADQATCTGATDWTTGWIVFADRDADGDRDLDPDGDPATDDGDSLLQAKGAAPPEYTLNATANSFVRFGSSGTSFAPETFNLVRTGCVGPKARRVNVSLVGRVSTTTVACP
jgi:type IV fimbrial biogenesis protein FimT